VLLSLRKKNSMTAFSPRLRAMAVNEEDDVDMDMEMDLDVDAEADIVERPQHAVAPVVVTKAKYNEVMKYAPVIRGKLNDPQIQARMRELRTSWAYVSEPKGGGSGTLIYQGSTDGQLQPVATKSSELVAPKTSASASSSTSSSSSTSRPPPPPLVPSVLLPQQQEDGPQQQQQTAKENKTRGGVNSGIGRSRTRGSGNSGRGDGKGSLQGKACRSPSPCAANKRRAAASFRNSGSGGGTKDMTIAPLPKQQQQQQQGRTNVHSPKGTTNRSRARVKQLDEEIDRVREHLAALEAQRLQALTS
jgi:hypothetical protein